MFTRLYELSRLLSLDERSPWELLNHGMPQNYEYGFAICFDQWGSFVGIKTISSNRGIGDRGVIYRPGPSSNSPPLVPCSRISEKLYTNLEYLFRVTAEVGREDGLPEEWKAWFGRIAWQNKDLQRKIVAEQMSAMADTGLGQKREDGRIRYGYWFPARIVETGDIRPVYELEAAKQLMVKKTVAIWQTYSQKSVNRPGICSVCGLEKKEVFGNFSELKCYILDKPGLIAGGFNLEAAAKNFPVCRDCCFCLAAAIDYAKRNLTASMAGAYYLVLPYSTAPEDIKQLMLDKLSQDPRCLSINSDKCDLLVDFEENLLELILDEDLEEQLALSLIFFNEKQKEWKIVAEIQQVLPGRMRQIWQARRKIARDPLLAPLQGGRWEANISAAVVRTFSGGKLKSKSATRTFYHWMEAIFGHGRIDRRVLIVNIVKALLDCAKSAPEQLPLLTARGWAFFMFCGLVNLMEQEEYRIMTFQDTVYGRYIQDHPGFFSRRETAVAFLTGCYVNAVCECQRKMRGLQNTSRAPFARKFQGRLLSARLLRRLFQQGHHKLAQYDCLGWVKGDRLEEELARAWVECENNWNIDDQEATFAFTIGFCLRHSLLAAKSPQDREDENESKPDQPA